MLRGSEINVIVVIILCRVLDVLKVFFVGILEIEPILGYLSAYLYRVMYVRTGHSMGSSTAQNWFEFLFSINIFVLTDY